MKRHALRVLGLGFLGTGFVGVVVPGLPTTVFWLLAAWCFGHSSPRLRAWVFRRGRTGEVVRQMVEERSLSRRSKTAASIGITLGMGASCVAIAVAGAWSPVWAAVFGGSFALALAMVWGLFRTAETAKPTHAAPRRIVGPTTATAAAA